MPVAMKRRLLILALVAATSLVLSTSLFVLFERDNPGVRDLGDAVWWWVVTAGTVGYGDIVPLTWPGRLVAIFAIVTGFYIFASVVAIAAESAHAYLERRSRGTAAVACRDHVVLCEYTAIADELIQSLPSIPEFADREVVIVSDLVERNPYPRHHFVRGVPINPACLRMAGVERAAYVFVFANLRFADPDVKTLHVVQRVADLNPRATILAEMIDPRNDLLEHAPAGLAVLDSRELIRAVLRDRRIDPTAWLRPGGGRRTGDDR